MELQQEDIIESNQSVEPALSSPRPPPTRPLHPMPLQAPQTFQSSVDGTDSYNYSIAHLLDEFQIGGTQPSSVTTGNVSTDLATSGALSFCSIQELMCFSDASQAALALPPGSSGRSAGSTASNIPVMLLELASSLVTAECAEEKRVKRHQTDFADGSRAELICAICQSKPAEWKDCPHAECKGKAWCDVCNRRWHSSNPRRKGHKLMRIRGALICAICEGAPVTWKDCPAAECKGQAWCEGCNTLWHSDNPRRKEHQPTRVVKSEVKSPSRDPSKTPVTEVQGSHKDDDSDLHLTSCQQSAPAMSFPQLSSVASAAPAEVQSASLPRIHPTLTHLNQLFGGSCYCISRTLDGRLLLGRDGILEIRDPDGKLLNFKRVEELVKGACELMGRFYLVIDKRHSSSRRISVRDGRSLEESYFWTLPDGKGITNLAVLGQRLVVPDPHHSKLLVYSSEGKLLSEPAVSGEPTHVSTSGTDIIVSDGRNNTVSVLDTTSSDFKLKFTYAGLKYPTAATVSADGHLYVGSLTHKKNLHVLSVTGELIAKLHHKDLSGCLGLYITGDKLLSATNRGLHLYQLGR